MSYLGLDLGTSGLRAVLVDEAGAVIGSAERGYHVSRPRPGWSEQSPADWITALDGAVNELKGRFACFADLKGIGVAGQMHGATLLDESGQVLRPCILWNDTRSAHEAAVLDGLGEFRSITGNIVFPGFTAPKLAWVRTHEPELFARIAKVLLPAAFINHYLTGEHASDMSDASGTGWLDIARRDWCDALLSHCHLDRSQMPVLVEGSAPIGHLRAELRAHWGLDHAVVVCGGGGDNAATACGIGAVDDGEGFVSLGTSGVVLVARQAASAMPDMAIHTLCHAIPDRWCQMGVMLAATDCLNWLGQVTEQSPVALVGELDGDLQAPGPICFYPYLSGERTPHNDARIRGAFTGLAAMTRRADLTRAVLEGVAFGLRESLDALREAGTDGRTLAVVGGGSDSPYWLKIIATLFEQPLTVPDHREYAAGLGAANLARGAATGAASSDFILAPSGHAIVEPVTEQIAAFGDAYQAFRSAFAGLKAIQ